MSYEVTLVSHIIAELSQKLSEAEIEIVETHHNQKKDSPSGTALMLADSINSANHGAFSYNFNRMQKTEKRSPKEIGFSSIRGGNIAGEHSVFFFSPNETLEIKHTAHSRSIFAEGSIKILNSLKVVDYLCFGAETSDIDVLDDISDVLFKEPKIYKSLLSSELKKGISFPKARENALSMFLSNNSKYNNVLSSPNNILGIEYMKALKKYKSNIKPISIARFESNHNDINYSRKYC